MGLCGDSADRHHGSGRVACLVGSEMCIRDSPPYNVIKLIESGGISWTYDDDPEIAISIVASWGYAATVPTAIMEAGALLSAYYYRARKAGPDQDRTIIANGTVIAPSSVPGLVEEMIAPYRIKFQ